MVMSIPTPQQSSELRSLTTALLERYQFMRQAGISFNGSRDMYEVLGYPRILSVKEYRDRYARGGISKRIVEAYPKATWRGGVKLQEDEDPKVTTAFEKDWEDLEKRLKIWTMLQRADTLAGLSTYSILLIGAPGDYDQPLPKGKPGQILFLTAFAGGGGPGLTQGASSSANYVDATIQEFDQDVTSPRFGLPTRYQLRRLDLVSPQFQKPVHWSRVIHIAEGLLDNEVYGIPVLENIWNLLDDLDKVTGGGAEAFWLRANQGLHLNVDKDAALSDPEKAAIKEQAEEYQHQMRRILQTRKVEVTPLGSDVAQFGPQADAILTQIAGSKGIPKRILMGSEMGQLASGQDADNWNTQVQDRRTGYAGPSIVRPLVDRLIEYGYLPTPKDYDVVWPTIESLTETEKAAGAGQWANVNKTMGVTIFTDDEIREKWYGLDPLTKKQKTPVPPPPPAAPTPTPAPDLGIDTGKINPMTGEPIVAESADLRYDKDGELISEPSAIDATEILDKNGEPVRPEALTLLEEAIEKDDLDAICRIVGLGGPGSGPQPGGGTRQGALARAGKHDEATIAHRKASELIDRAEKAQKGIGPQSSIKAIKESADRASAKAFAMSKDLGVSDFKGNNKDLHQTLASHHMARSQYHRQIANKRDLGGTEDLSDRLTVAQEDFLVYRAVEADVLPQVGTTIVSREEVLTSWNRDVMQSHVEHELNSDVQIVDILIPRGASFSEVPNGNEDEILLPRGSRFLVTAPDKLTLL
jgi:hypothetical protein